MGVQSAHAGILADSPTGLASPQVLIDFGTGLYANGTAITNEFAGVTFGPIANYDTAEAPPYFSGGHIKGVNGNSTVGAGPIMFTTAISDVAFTYWSNISNTTFSAYFQGGLVESFSASTNYQSEGNNVYYGFTNSHFDEVRVIISHPNKFNALDNLQFNVAAVPLPANVTLLLSGFAGLIGLRRLKKPSA